MSAYGFGIESAEPVDNSIRERIRDGFRRQRWWILRVVALPFQLLFFALVAFLLVRLIPGDPVLTVTGNQATAEQYAKVQEQMGLSGSLWDQISAYFGQLLRFDLGRSLLTERPLVEEFGQRLPATIELAAMALIVSLVLVAVAAYFAVIRPIPVLSAVIRGYSRAAGAIPDFAVGVLGIFLFYAMLHLSPAPLGRLSPMVSTPPSVTRLPFVDAVISGDAEAVSSMAWHLALPIAVLVIAHSAVVLKLLIEGMDDELHKPATLFRVSTGASESVIAVSIFRRALPAAVTMSGTMFGYLIGGAVIVEALFAFGGMGQYLTEALAGADLTAMQGFLVTIAAVSLAVFLLVDICNMTLDPRRRPGVQTEG